MAEINAFATGDAFCLVDGWVPGIPLGITWNSFLANFFLCCPERVNLQVRELLLQVCFDFDTTTKTSSAAALTALWKKATTSISCGQQGFPSSLARTLR